MQPTAEQFTEKAWAAIVAAQQLAKASRHQQLETEHLLLALLEQNGLAGRILAKAGVDVGNFEASVQNHLKRQPSMTSACSRKLEKSIKSTRQIQKSINLRNYKMDQIYANY